VRLEIGDGERVTMSHALSDWTKLADTIGDEATRRQLATAQKRFRAGEKLAFDTLAVSQNGVAFEGAHIPWPEVKDVGVFNGHLVVFPTGNQREQSVPLGKTPNYLVLLALLDEARGTPHR
jgi:hypothetical protein